MVFVIILIEIFLFSSCGNVTMHTPRSSVSIMENTAENIIECINAKDKKRLKSLFSNEVVNSGVNLDNMIEGLFKNVDSEIVFSSADYGGHTSGEYKNVAIEYWASFTSTDDTLYSMRFLAYEYSSDPDMDGIYMLALCRDNSEKSLSFGNITAPGVYCPSEEQREYVDNNYISSKNKMSLENGGYVIEVEKNYKDRFGKTYFIIVKDPSGEKIYNSEEAYSLRETWIRWNDGERKSFVVYQPKSNSIKQYSLQSDKDWIEESLYEFSIY